MGSRVRVHLAAKYRLVIWSLLPLSLGIGTVAMWLWALRWPRRIDQTGLTLRYGRRLPWSAVKKIGVLKDSREGESRTIRLEIHFDRGVVRLPVWAFDDGEKVASEIRAFFGAMNSARLGEPSSASARQTFAPGTGLLDHAVT